MANKYLFFMLSGAFFLFFSPRLSAQGCVLCGNSSDGAFIATIDTTLAGDTYEFSSFTIQSGVTVTVTGTQPLIIRSSGIVHIAGTLSLNGENGNDGITYLTFGTGGLGVAGGSNGGDGIYSDVNGPLDGFPGSGSGSGGLGSGWSGGGGGGYANTGASSPGPGGIGGSSYGDNLLSLLEGGSGGGGGSGGYSCGSGGGGGGGGYLYLASCDSIVIAATGTVSSRGGNGGSDGTGNCGGGGGGSGGTIWLECENVVINGILDASGGLGGSTSYPPDGFGGDGSVGRIRIDGTQSGSPVSILPAVGYTGSIITLSVIATSAPSGAICIGDTLQLIPNYVSGATGPITYSWAPGNLPGSPYVSPTISTVYTLQAVDSIGCSGTDSISITVNPLPTLSFSLSGDTACVNGGNIPLSASPAGGTFSGNGVSGSTFDPAVAGLGLHTITYAYTDGNGCYNETTDDIFISACLGTEQPGFQLFRIYPNPADQYVNVESNHTGMLQIELRDMSGKIVSLMTATPGISLITVPTEHLPGGVYLLKAYDEKTNVTKRIVVSH